MTGQIQFSKWDRLLKEGKSYKPVEATKAGQKFVNVDDAQDCFFVDRNEFLSLLERPEVDFTPNYYHPDFCQTRKCLDGHSIASLSKDKRNEVLWRHAYVTAFLTFYEASKCKRTDASIQAIMPTLVAHVNELARTVKSRMMSPRAGRKNEMRDPPSPKTLRIWIKRYVDGGFSPLALIPLTHRSGNREPRYCSETNRILSDCIQLYLNRDQLSRKQVADATVTKFETVNKQRELEGKEPLPIPSKRQVEREIKKLDPYLVCMMRNGVAAANREFRLYESGLSAIYPMERIEIDEWNVDLITILESRGALDHLTDDQRAILERGRRWLYLAIDCATRCVVAMRIARTPNAEDSKALLYDVTIDKTALAEAAGAVSGWGHSGGLVTVATDLGSAFVDDGFETAVIEAGGISERPPGGIPQLRSRVERIFGTLGTTLMPYLSGRTFSNPMKRGDYPSKQLAALNDDALLQILIRYVVDVYHNTPHGGLKGETPNNCWKRLAKEKGVAPPPSAITRCRAFGLHRTPTVSGRGVRIFGIDYTCKALRDFYLYDKACQAEVKIDLSNLGWVLVRSGRDWVVANAIQRGFDGVSYETWEAAACALRQKHQYEATLSEQTVKDAIAAIQEINKREMQRFNVHLKRLTPSGLKRAKDDLFSNLSINPDDDTEFEFPPEGDLFGYQVSAPDEETPNSGPEQNGNALWNNDWDPENDGDDDDDEDDQDWRMLDDE